MTIYSVTRANSSSISNVNEIPLLITVLTPQGGNQELTELLSERLNRTIQEIDGVEFEGVQRFGELVLCNLIQTCSKWLSWSGFSLINIKGPKSS